MPLYLWLCAEALSTMLSAITPIILLLLLVAILIATIQATLQLEDMALSLLPRTVLVILLVLTGGFGAFGTMCHLAASWLGAAGPLVHRAWY
ncbi:MAG TPA: flagellar biosynthetic protein FliQ [Acidisoma sp.]|jgi:flagellar biosynthesis protein FliQ|uniref:flagellar biosynthetic protein FliQ n=1 Tax=Acidisoma sp. TaxID=1872115 RepID=UPI002C419EA2|nr:flagellar biosynthetic protein FliQ [Acidisoma sp.]HTI00497.1 flagellar biosynthetic protein FliQ [Acidisoma sp.]